MVPAAGREHKGGGGLPDGGRANFPSNDKAELEAFHAEAEEVLGKPKEK